MVLCCIIHALTIVILREAKDLLSRLQAYKRKRRSVTKQILRFSQDDNSKCGWV